MSVLLIKLIRGAARLAGDKFFAVAVAALLGLSSFLAAPSHARAQEPAAEEEVGAARGGRAGRANVNLLMRLNLTPEQFRQLREIRRQSEPELRALGRRLHLARRALDEAVYADAVAEANVEERAREVAAAQAALVRLRALTELRVRRVLTPEQLQSFRELRQQARQRQRSERRLRRRGTQPAASDALDTPAAPAGRGRRRRP